MSDPPTNPEQIGEKPGANPPPVPLAADSPPVSPVPAQQVVGDKLSAIKTFAFGGGTMSARTEKNFCVLIHLAGCLFWFVPPLILWMWKRDDSAAIDAHGKEAVNFQLTFFVLMIAFGVVSFGFLGLVVYFTSIILAAIAAANASQGKTYRYPLTYRAIK